jgi:phosphoribosylformimino-5-aminoimidazole carboxamide ribotide isomerase
MAPVMVQASMSKSPTAKALTLYPAIDLKGGRCVRLSQGDFDKATIYNEDPADQAKTFVAQGFGWIHVVDLDGSVEGRAVNGAAVSAILKTAPVPVQLGGGVRDMAAVARWLEAGISRVILGTAAVREPEFVKKAAALYPEQIAVGLDVRDGKVAVQGWLEDSGLSALDVAKRFEDAGVAALVVTDISRDGMLTGVNPEVFGQVADAVSIPVIAAGGMTTVADIETLRRRKGAPISGAVLGKSLYAGTIKPAEALAAARAL